ncbi:MAG: hypothetical protein UX91_C0002G0018 [Candidatus Amesbacteria bacterium GW2011_GWB1_47_19]|nr:MAG: hypothetical protein UW51_C0004G0018 [Candidatus Amesbacteria bacterium GW2011_GWA1_44_24]KKU31693.1 MAG: hypothetical protein UX46_C0003G0018 [Candidatus Amesbacteria bacterium GW2011_GWC1_46_24]KKU67606.1 MAG: hypothetical protein UX91_C0002G0018 [Candidatus Amesbacteria bacterium GW2011_GWB1_47_19]OGD06456.1 MAG: hypothetical protein A2379_02340 [Candidatus Amesbacteria bacterium RIFOXYB1_FULL_47_13]HBC72860.1 hypothetical protein [Candidatus Amesbacteria bacterium]
MTFNFWLSFSDSVKYAEAAINFNYGRGLVIHHSLFNPVLLSKYTPGDAFSPGFHPLTSWVLSIVFRIFPLSDSTVVIFGVGVWLLIAVLVYLIGKKLHSIQAGITAVVFLLGNMYFLDYARNSTSEIFLSLEIILAVILYLYNPKRKWLSLVPVTLMFFTRAQSIVIAVSLFILVLIFSRRRLLVLAVAGIIILTGIPFSSRYPFVSPAFYFNSIYSTPSDNNGAYMRGAPSDRITTRKLAAKTVYNLYNFLKFPDRIVNPIILALFLYGVFALIKQRELRGFYIYTLISGLLLIIAASLTLPIARYVHPVLPLIFICAAISLVELAKNLRLKYLFAGLLIFIVSLPMIGYITLDSRYRRQQFNTNQPPAYKAIADVMAQNIPRGKLTITNLDAWAAWYHGLTTMWFPLAPEMIKPYPGKINNVEYIVITNYLENDANFSLGDWKEVVYSPENIKNPYLMNNYRVLKIFVIPATENYDNQEYRGTILIKLVGL